MKSIPSIYLPHPLVLQVFDIQTKYGGYSRLDKYLTHDKARYQEAHGIYTQGKIPIEPPKRNETNVYHILPNTDNTKQFTTALCLSLSVGLIRMSRATCQERIASIPPTPYVLPAVSLTRGPVESQSELIACCEGLFVNQKKKSGVGNIATP